MEPYVGNDISGDDDIGGFFGIIHDNTEGRHLAARRD